MNDLLAKLLVLAGVIFIVAGWLMFRAGRSPFPAWFGRWPGDIHLEGRYGQLHFPIVTCLVLSLLLTLLFHLWRHGAGR